MTSDAQEGRSSRKAVLFSSAVLLTAWCSVNLPRLASGPGGVIPFLLGLFFAVLLVFRSKIPADEGFPAIGGKRLGVLAVAGAVAVVAGLVVPIRQFEWLGVLVVLYAALGWALPRRYGRDLLLALFIVYWIHPLPGKVFGPLQLAMQSLSVQLSEGLLHVFGVPAWGDGLVLRTGLRVFEVPEACSGMKTAVTVLFCGLGIGLLMRFRWFLIAALAGIGLVQVLLLNVIRISGMVWLGRNQPADWNEKTLHDTMGLFLLLAVGLIHLDAVLVRQAVRFRQRKRELYAGGDHVGEPEEKRRRWPEFWRLVFSWWKPVVVLVAVVAVVVVTVQRLRPHRRAELLRDVVEGMLTQDLPNAERAVRAALVWVPNHDGLKYDLALILLNRGRRDEALALIRKKPEASLTLQERVLEARALLELNRVDELKAAIRRFPTDSAELPGVALVLAEFNAIMDRPGDVARHVVKAARGIGSLERIRRLFPYMASRNLWDSIRASDSDMPYSLPIQGVIAAEARLRANDVAGAANVLRRAMHGREQEAVFLGSVIRVAREQPGSEWVARFESIVKKNLARFKPADLALSMEGGFAVGRPDLGWLAYRRLLAVAPDDPVAMLAPAEHGRKWFAFRHDALGMEKPASGTTLDAKPFYLAVKGVSPWRELWDRIPLADELGNVVTAEGYRRRLTMALDSLERMEQAGKLDPRLQVLYAQVLGELGRWDEAHAKLDAFAKLEPARQRDLLLAHAALYKANGNAEMVFETLSDYMRQESHPSLAVSLDLANAALALDLGAYAMGVMEEIHHDFPESGDWGLAMAGLWVYFGFSEEALFLIDRLDMPAPPGLRARLLMETGRVVEGQKIVAVENIPDLPVPKQQTQLLAPAEWAIEWRGGVLKDADYGRAAAALRVRQTAFPKALNRLKAQWFAARGSNETSNVVLWEGIGRDAREKAQALCDLALLLMEQGRPQDAQVAVRRAVELAPLWGLPRRLSAILGADIGMLEESVRMCPRDSDLWLAYLVRRGQKERSGAWAEQAVARAVNERRYPPATLVRAGDFLIRNDLTNAACAAARAAIKDGHGLLPAYVLGIQCAIKTRDMAWATLCARNGAEQALEPWPFYKIIVGLKSKAGVRDPEVIRALEGLAARYPSDRIWAERLGEIYFLQGQTDRAMGVLQDAISRQKGQKQAPPRTYLLAAESARREGSVAKAATILKLARSLYPDDVNVLNNLAYTLAQSPSTVGEAAALLPELLKKGRDDFAIYDTAVFISLRTGDLKAAEGYMRKSLGSVKKGDYAWIEVYLNAAETQIKLGRLKEARENLDLVMKTPERTPAMDARARELQNELTLKEREKQRWF